jgi:hypothetical protein
MKHSIGTSLIDVNDDEIHKNKPLASHVSFSDVKFFVLFLLCTKTVSSIYKYNQ